METEHSAQEEDEDDCAFCEETVKDNDWTLIEDDANTDQSEDDEENDELLDKDGIPLGASTVWLV